MANADFVASYYPFASRVASMTGIDPRLVLAQAALETGWGKSAPGQNYFGIKAPSGDTMPTLEYVNGRPVQTRAAFRSYESPEQSFEDYARLMASPRYERVRTSPTLEAQAEALQAAGYATDPDYAKKLVQIASGIPQTGARSVADRAMVELGRTRPQPAGGEVMDGLLGTQRMEEQPARPMAQPERRGLGATFSDPAFLENLALAFNTLRMTPDENLATVIRGRQERRADTATRNRTIEFLRQRGREDLAAAVESGAIDAKTAAAQIFAQPERTAMQQNYEFFLRKGMTPEQALQAVRSGTTVNLPGAPTIGTIPPGYQAIQDPATGEYQYKPIPGGPVEAGEKTEAERKATAEATALNSIALIDSVLSDPNLGAITGMVQGRLPPMTQVGTDLNVKIEQLQGQAFLQAFESLKGGGAITEREGIAAQNAIARLNRAQSEEAFRDALVELRTIVQRGLGRIVPQQGAGAGAPDFSTMSDEELRAYIAEQDARIQQLRGQ